MIESILHGLFLGLIGGIFRWKHGGGEISRSIAILMISVGLVVVTPALHEQENLWVIIIGLVYLGLAPGWGKYFGAITGEYPTHEKELFFIDWMIDPWGAKYPYLAGTVGMTLRWLICFAPLFFLLDWAINKPVYSLGILVLVGPLYWICGRIWGKDQREFTQAEMSTGALLCFALGI